MSEKSPLEELLKSWKTPSPRENFEANVLRRLRPQPVHESFWQRWFVEPWELWRQQAMAVGIAAVVALVLSIGLFQLTGESSRHPSSPSQASIGLNSFATFPEGSVTTAYLELKKR